MPYAPQGVKGIDDDDDVPLLHACKEPTQQPQFTCYASQQEGRSNTGQIKCPYIYIYVCI